MNFKILNEDGKTIECEMLHSFKDPKTNISYILYTDGTMGEDGKLEVYASRYELVNDDYILRGIENDSEWNMIDEVLGEILNK